MYPWFWTSKYVGQTFSLPAGMKLKQKSMDELELGDRVTHYLKTQNPN